MSSAAVKRYWSLLVKEGCCICGAPAEVAHAHGPSVTERGFQKPKGKKFAWQDWLTLPLCANHHRLLDVSLDTAMKTWEATHGRVADWLDLMIHRTGIDCWAKARALMKAPLPRRAA